MKISYFTPIILFISCLIFHCGISSCKSHPESGMKKKITSQTPAPKTRLLLINQAFVPDSIQNFKLKKVWIEGTLMFLDISYSGGCKNHKWDLIFNGMLAKSLPPKAVLFLNHDSGGDLCKKLILDTLCFNLSPLRTYGQKVMVNVRGNEGYSLLSF